MLTQVACTHPRHPSPRKQYALKLVINRGMTCDPREVSRRYGTEGVIVRRLPQHDNLCPMLAEFVSAVPADILDRLTPVRLLLSAVSLVNRSS